MLKFCCKTVLIKLKIIIKISFFVKQLLNFIDVSDND